MGTHDLLPADDAGIADAVVCATFLRFKGLELPAVVVTDSGIANTKREVRLYIALTRALDLVRIVADETTIGQDPFFASSSGRDRGRPRTPVVKARRRIPRAARPQRGDRRG